MKMSDEQQFQKGTYGKAADQMKIDDYWMFEDHPCRVLNFSISKRSRHTHVRVSLIAKDIFTGKIYQDQIRASNVIPVPFVTIQEFTLLGIQEDGFLVLLLNNGSTKEDLKLPDGVEDDKLVKEINSMFGEENHKEILISVISAMGKEKVVGVRVSQIL